MAGDHLGGEGGHLAGVLPAGDEARLVHADHLLGPVAGAGVGQHVTRVYT